MKNRKYLLFLLVFISIFSLISCGKKKDKGSSGSDPVNPPVVTPQLSTVNISINDNVISWVPALNALSYDIYKDNTFVINVLVNGQTSMTYTIVTDTLEDGTYEFYVIGKAANYLDSDSSNKVSYEKKTVVPPSTKLSAPVVVQDTLAMRWKAVKDAESYDIYDGDNVIKNITEIYISYSDLTLSIGEHSLSVVAKATSIDESDKSNVVTYTQSKKVVSLDVTCSKTEYKSGEYFDLTSLTVVAHYNDGSTENVAEPIVNICEALQPTNKEVIVSYGKVGYKLSITVKNGGVSVQEAKTKVLNDTFNLEGIVIGCGATAYCCVLLVKDVDTNDIVGITGLGNGTGTNPTMGSFAVGDRIVMPVKVVKNSSSGLSDYMFTCGYNGTGTVTNYIVSHGNSAEFDKTNVKTITNQDELNSLFLTKAEGEKYGYSYVKLSGHMYFVNYGSDYNTMYSRIVFDANCTDNRIKCEGFDTRALSPVFRNVYTKVNTGKTFSELVYGCTSLAGAKTTYADKHEFYGDIYAVVCGANSYYIQFIVLNEEDVEAQETAVKEIKLVEPLKKDYCIGESLSFDGGHIETIYEDGKVEITSIVSSIVETNFNSEVEGTYTVTIKYGSFEQSYNVSVITCIN